MGIELLTNKNVLVSALGGNEQERQRKGSRYALAFTMPPMRYADSMAWDDLTAEGATVLMQVHQPGFDTGVSGAPLVNGGGQAGTSLMIDGLTPAYVLRKGQFLSVISSGRRFLYRVAADVIANGSGQATVTLRTMLRYPPADNDVVEIAQPMIEGFVRDMQSVEVGVDRMVQLAFTVRER
jgi:hypothetical protein